MVLLGFRLRYIIISKIIIKDYGALGKASEIASYYRSNKPVSGTDLISGGIEGTKAGTEIIKYLRNNTTKISASLLMGGFQNDIKINSRCCYRWNIRIFL